ncbi:polyadenylate-binding protein 7 isoform X2 [Elaeis guineensis]|uniref:Polyadenylate-binding protein n=1 Tax=Elaeis guineensis var. tenera TaxID=51953 RepID=A0A6I9QHP4_ELAGV|nr:polyadenylate-binding protein 7 isoform X2 [Elaeis guineensis]
MAMAPTVPSPALYVGDLHPAVTDSHLFDLFSSVGAVTSVRVCRDIVSGRSLGYGYVNYVSSQDASQAIEKLNHASLNGKPIRIMWSHRDPEARNSGIGNLFVKNLPDSIDNVRLHEMFEKFGNILSCKVVTMQDGKSKGYGFVQFDSEERANSAIEKLNGSIIDGKKIYVGNFIKKSERVLPDSEPKYTNLYLKNLDGDITEELIQLKFSEFGKIKNVVIAKDAEGNSKGFGFVNFENPDSARRAIKAMNGAQLASKTLYVGRAQKKEERQEILRQLFEEKREEQLRKNMASNVYVKNIDDDVDDDALREHFSQCGNIISAKVMCDDKGISKGFGFVCYSKPEEASRAVNTLHGSMFLQKPLYVAIAQRKEDRKAQLQLQFAQRMGLMNQTLELIPAWRPSGFVSASRPPFQPMQLPVVPNTQRQHRQIGGQMNGHMLSESDHSIPHICHLHQPDHSLGALKDFNSHQRSGQRKYVPNRRQHEMINDLMVPSAASNSRELKMLSSMLAAASPQQQKQIIGEHLFPLVQKHKPDLAAKITGMLLEMDNSELLLLLESPESLAAKVEEAVQVLKLSKTKSGGAGHGKYLSAEVAVN